MKWEVSFETQDTIMSAYMDPKFKVIFFRSTRDTPLGGVFLFNLPAGMCRGWLKDFLEREEWKLDDIYESITTLEPDEGFDFKPCFEMEDMMLEDWEEYKNESGYLETLEE